MSDEYMTGYHAGYAAGMQNSWPEDALARIEELERERDELKLSNASYSEMIECVAKERDVAWNEAIEAAALAVEKYTYPLDPEFAAAIIHALKKGN